MSLFVPDLCTELILKYRNYNINEDTGIAFIHILFILSKKQLSSASLLSPKSASTRDTLLTPKHPGKSDSSMQRSSSPWSFAPCGYFSFTAIQRWAKCTSNVSPVHDSPAQTVLARPSTSLPRPQWSHNANNHQSRLSSVQYMARNYLVSQPWRGYLWLQGHILSDPEFRQGRVLLFLYSINLDLKKNPMMWPIWHPRPFSTCFLFFEAMWHSLSSYYCAFSAGPASLIMSCHTAETLIN